MHAQAEMSNERTYLYLKHTKAIRDVELNLEFA
jgi:hypothetical protein